MGVSTGKVRKHISSRSAGYLLNRLGVLSLFSILVLAGWKGRVGIVVIISLFLAAAGLAKLWSYLSLAGIRCRHSLSQSRIFPGETVELALRLLNRKPLPLPWIRVEDQIPLNMAPEGAVVPGKRPGFGSIHRGTALSWYRTVTWRIPLTAHKRGYYPIGPITVTSGDLFGLYARSLTLPDTENLLVYPRLYPIGRLLLPPVQPIGDSKTDRRVFEDPARVIGVRDYQVFDSLKHIHWKASARSRILQVKVFEPTTTFKAALFLVVDSFHEGETFLEEEFELGISSAASIAYHIFGQGCPVGLFANTASADGSRGIRILPGADRNLLMRILEALAKTTPRVTAPFDIILERERERLPGGTTLVFICSRPSDSLVSFFRALQGSGHSLLVLLIGEQAKALPATIPYQIIRHPAELGEIECPG